MTNPLRTRDRRVIIAMEDWACGAGKRRHQPRPIAGNSAPGVFLILNVLHELRRCGVMIHNGDFCCLERQEYGCIEFDEGAVLPQGCSGGEVEFHEFCHGWQKVVAIGVSEVSGGDFGSHVEPAERCGGIEFSIGGKHHVRDSGKRRPANTKFVEAGQVRVADWNFEHRI